MKEDVSTFTGPDKRAWSHVDGRDHETTIRTNVCFERNRSRVSITFRTSTEQVARTYSMKR